VADAALAAWRWLGGKRRHGVSRKCAISDGVWKSCRRDGDGVAARRGGCSSARMRNRGKVRICGICAGVISKTAAA
jgi:hypothetical protein